MQLLASGRTADVYAWDEQWVIRRYRAPHEADVEPELTLMAFLRERGYPVPRVRPAAEVAGADPRTDLVLERVTAPTLAEHALSGRIGAGETGEQLALLLRQLHAIRPRVPHGRILHLDLHPENVLWTDGGPVVIDWSTAAQGRPVIDWGMSALVLAETVVARPPHAPLVRETLAAFLSRCDDVAGLTQPDSGGLDSAVARRTTNPTLSREETGRLGAAAALVRELAV